MPWHGLAAFAPGSIEAMVGKASPSRRGSPHCQGRLEDLGRGCIAAVEEPGARMLAFLPVRGWSPVEGMQPAQEVGVWGEGCGQARGSGGDAAWWKRCRWAGGDAAWWGGRSPR